MTLQEVFEDFIESRQLANLTQKTISDYEQFLLFFLRFHGADRDFSDIVQKDINNYILSLKKRELSNSTLSTYIRHLKVFLKWASENYEVAYNYKSIRVPKMPKKQVHIYSDQEVRQIFDNISAESEWLTLRNKAIVALMYDSGLRQSEICTLKWKWVSIADKRMKVLGKGNKERTVPLGSLAIHFLKSYRSECPFASENVFVERYGDSITNNTVKLMISRLAKKLDFELSSHKLRHNFATNYCIYEYEHHGKVDIFSLMHIMGHANIETTQRYLHFAYEIIASRNYHSHLDALLGA